MRFLYWHYTQPDTRKSARSIKRVIFCIQRHECFSVENARHLLRSLLIAPFLSNIFLKRLAQEFRIVLPTKVKIKNSTSSV